MYTQNLFSMWRLSSGSELLLVPWCCSNYVLDYLYRVAQKIPVKISKLHQNDRWREFVTTAPVSVNYILCKLHFRNWQLLPHSAIVHDMRTCTVASPPLVFPHVYFGAKSSSLLRLRGKFSLALSSVRKVLHTIPASPILPTTCLPNATNNNGPAASSSPFPWMYSVEKSEWMKQCKDVGRIYRSTIGLAYTAGNKLKPLAESLQIPHLKRERVSLYTHGVIKTCSSSAAYARARERRAQRWIFVSEALAVFSLPGERYSYFALFMAHN